jgi:hypothetical protein
VLFLRFRVQTAFLTDRFCRLSSAYRTFDQFPSTGSLTSLVSFASRWSFHWDFFSWLGCRWLLFCCSFQESAGLITHRVTLSFATSKKPPGPFWVTKTVSTSRRTSTAEISLYSAALKSLRIFGYEIRGCDFQSVSASFFPILFLPSKTSYSLQLEGTLLNYPCWLTKDFHLPLPLARRLNTKDGYCLNLYHRW